MSAADEVFDAALSRALEQGGPINLADLERGDWATVCAVGEGRPSGMLEGRPRRGEAAYDEFIDAGSFYFGRGGRGALAFVYPEGVEVRPLTELAVNEGSPINTCVPRTAATLVRSPESGWHFSGYAPDESAALASEQEVVLGSLPSEWRRVSGGLDEPSFLVEGHRNIGQQPTRIGVARLQPTSRGLLGTPEDVDRVLTQGRLMEKETLGTVLGVPLRRFSGIGEWFISDDRDVQCRSFGGEALPNTEYPFVRCRVFLRAVGLGYQADVPYALSPDLDEVLEELSTAVIAAAPARERIKAAP